MRLKSVTNRFSLNPVVFASDVIYEVLFRNETLNREVANHFAGRGLLSLPLPKKFELGNHILFELVVLCDHSDDTTVVVSLWRVAMRRVEEVRAFLV